MAAYEGNPLKTNKENKTKKNPENINDRI